MPAVKLATTITRVIREIKILEDYYNKSSSLELRFQYLIAEVIVLRLFAVLEDGIAEIAYKLAAGAMYLSGRAPRLSVVSRSLDMARTNLINYHRTKGIQLRWSKAKYIKESVENVLSSTESFINVALINANVINEMRVVRNYIAHRSETSRRDFKSIINQRFGSPLKISAGSFLLSTKRIPKPIMVEYLIQTRIILHDFAKG